MTAPDPQLVREPVTPKPKSCAHCGRDLTGASIHTIQGVDVCADIRHCLAQQAERRNTAQDERNGDVRVVAATLRWIRAEISPERKLLGAVRSGAWTDLEDRFMDRIAALEARDAKAGE